MSEMIERVAKAIALDDCQTWNELDAVNRGMFLSFARAAIAAMREPTEAMLEAGTITVSKTGVISISTQDAARIWRAMVDAALHSAPLEG